MNKTILEKIKEASHKAEIKYVNFFNDGTVSQDNSGMDKSFNDATKPFEGRIVLNEMVDGSKFFVKFCDFDTIDMDLLLGLVYYKKDINDNNEINKNAEPIKGIVRYYTGKFGTFHNGEKTNSDDGYYPSIQGFVKYDSLMKEIKKSGLDYTGPETFEEFEEQILVGEPFDIKVSANLVEKENTKTDSKIKIKK